MSAISGTRRAMKEMADGTIRVQVDIDPSCRADFLRLFPNIDMPVALAPLVADFERAPAEAKPKGGELARLAGMFCQNADFLECFGLSGEGAAKAFIYNVCGVDSRAALDHDADAAERFHVRVRRPFVEWKQARGL